MALVARWPGRGPCNVRGRRAEKVHVTEPFELRRRPAAEGGLDAEDYPTLDDPVNQWHREERELRAGFERVTDEQIATCPPGDDNVLPLWRYLVYVVTHGIQQFSEAAVLLTRLGHSPGEIGFWSRLWLGRRADWHSG
jgi:hypothetical protein